MNRDDDAPVIAYHRALDKVEQREEELKKETKEFRDSVRKTVDKAPNRIKKLRDQLKRDSQNEPQDIIQARTALHELEREYYTDPTKITPDILYAARNRHYNLITNNKNIKKMDEKYIRLILEEQILGTAEYLQEITLPFQASSSST